MSKKHDKHKRGQTAPAPAVSNLGRLSHGHARPPSTSLWVHAADEIDALSPAALGGTFASPVVPAPGIVVAQAQPRFDLAAVDTKPEPAFDRDWAEKALKQERERLSALQERLYGERRRSLLLVFQAIDTGGKDGTIRSVLKGVNPQGCTVSSFKVPSSDELDHDFLWRYHARTPGRGMIGVFNRSHYEDVLVVRVLINDFERLLTESGTTLIKFFLHISREEQKERLEARIADPEKHWKFDPADLVERKSWGLYQDAFADALGRCSTPYAPWLVVPADRKWLRNYLVAKTVADTLEAMDPRYPEGPKDLDQLTVPD
jgi:PPK2 family polyphosphate:nucleotide phosphotransferase